MLSGGRWTSRLKPSDKSYQGAERNYGVGAPGKRFFHTMMADEGHRLSKTVQNKDGARDYSYDSQRYLAVVRRRVPWST